MQDIKVVAKELCKHFGDKAPPDQYLYQYHTGIKFWGSGNEVNIFKNPVDGVWLVGTSGTFAAFDRYYGALTMIDHLARLHRRQNVRMGP